MSSEIALKNRSRSLTVRMMCFSRSLRAHSEKLYIRTQFHRIGTESLSQLRPSTQRRDALRPCSSCAVLRAKWERILDQFCGIGTECLFFGAPRQNWRDTSAKFLSARRQEETFGGHLAWKLANRAPNDGFFSEKSSSRSPVFSFVSELYLFSLLSSPPLVFIARCMGNKD